jgi:hypothetical protein
MPTEQLGHGGASGVFLRRRDDLALEIDARIARAWSGHPRLFDVPATDDFLAKAARALQVLRELVPECCRAHVKPFLWTG